MRKLLIENNVVINMVEFDPDGDWAPPEGATLMDGIANIGDVWNGETFVTPPSALPAKTIIYKADIWRLATDAEAATIDAALNAQPVRLRRMWQDSQTLATTDEMYPMVKAAFEQAFGADRAAVLLEPTA